MLEKFAPAIEAMVKAQEAVILKDNESLIKENEYYKDDLVPTMRAKSKEMQRKFEEYEAERKLLQEKCMNLKSSFYVH